jgi:uncharacterized protein related to proFAR isomerase
LKLAHPGQKWIASGGIRTKKDLARLAEMGIESVLLASALHKGILTAADVAALAGN